MKSSLILIFFLFNNLLYSQPMIQWQKSFGGSRNDYANSIIQTSDGGFIIAGSSASNDTDITINNGRVDYWIVKINSSGTMQWQKSYGGSLDDYANSIRQTNDGGYIIAGYTESNDSDVTGNHGFRDFWIVKTDSIGSIDWEKNYGGSDFEIAYDIQQTNDGGYVVAGYSSSIDGDLAGANSNFQNYWLLKLDNSGLIQWYHLYGGSATDEAFSVQQTSDNGFVMVGHTYSSNGHVTGYHGNQDVWVVKTDSTGVIQWQKTLGGSASESANCIRQTTDGGYIVACSSSSTNFDVTGNHGGGDCWIVKLDSAGFIQWQKALGGSNADGASSVEQTTDGGYIVAGYSKSNDGDLTLNQGDYDCWIIKLSSAGNIKWQKSLGGTGTETANAIIQTSDGGFIMAGFAGSNDGDVAVNYGALDYWVVKLDSTQSVSVNNIQKSLNDFRIFPNPNNGVLKLHFNAENNSRAMISVVNLLNVCIYRNEIDVKAGTNEIDIDLIGNESGVYFLILNLSNDGEVRYKLVLQ